MKAGQHPDGTPGGHAQEDVGTVLVANPSADLYGSDRMMLETVRGLTARGWTVVVTTSVDGPLRGPLQACGARVVVVPAPVVRKSNLTPSGLVRLAASVVGGVVPMSKLLRQVKPDVVYINTLSIPFWLAVSRVFRIPTVLHVHEAETSISPVAAHGLALPTHLADRIIYNSETSRGAAKQVGSRRARRSRVIYNGVRAPRAATPAVAELTEPRLGYIGRLSPRKGVDVAVRAEAELVRRGVPAHLCIIGDTFPGYEWYEVELRELVAREGLDHRVTFAGFVDDVSSWLSDMDVLVVPSRGEESFGNVVIEGAIAGRPVIVSDHSGLREAASRVRAATLVPPDDPMALADAVERVMADWGTLRGVAFADADVVRDEFSPERFQDEVADVLAQVRSARVEKKRHAVAPSSKDGAAEPWGPPGVHPPPAHGTSDNPRSTALMRGTHL